METFLEDPLKQFFCPLTSPIFFVNLRLPGNLHVLPRPNFHIYSLSPTPTLTFTHFQFHSSPLSLSGRSIFLCQAISKCSLVETAFLLLVTVSTVSNKYFLKYIMCLCRELYLFYGVSLKQHCRWSKEKTCL